MFADSDVLHEKNSTALRDSFWKLPEGSRGIQVVVVEGEIARQDVSDTISRIHKLYSI